MAVFLVTSRSTIVSLENLITVPNFPTVPPTPSGCPAHIGEVWLLAGTFLKEALALSTVLGVFSPVRGGQHMGLLYLCPGLL